MTAGVRTLALHGLDVNQVVVEVDIANGLPSFDIVGLPDASIREARNRVRAAIRNSGFRFPTRRITVNLAPADLRKEGPAFDLAVAVALLAADGQCAAGPWADWAVLGELGLDGSVRAVAGTLALARVVRARLGTPGWPAGMVVPRGNLEEAMLVEGLPLCAVDTLRDLAEPAQRHVFIGKGQQGVVGEEGGGGADDGIGGVSGSGLGGGHGGGDNGDVGPDLAHVLGQETGKRALEIAAAGGHHLLLSGPPGGGKTLLARCLPGLLPPPTFAEAMEITTIYSVSGRLPSGTLVRRRPFRTPHHHITAAGLIGGGKPLQPGEISLAHHGVLFLDELGEYSRSVVELLRQPLEQGEVTLARQGAAVTFPASFTLVTACNPCPCGFLNDPTHACRCSEADIRRYQARVSGPLLDRIHLRVEVPAVDENASWVKGEGEAEGGGGGAGRGGTSIGSLHGSAAVAARVAAARHRQVERQNGRLNSRLGAADVSQLVRDMARGSGGSRLLEDLEGRRGLSFRGRESLLKVARTIADLAGGDDIREEHILEAFTYRTERTLGKT